MAQNGTTLTNAQGETADWIELYNASGAPTNLAGWYLTDSPGNLRKWKFPAAALDAYGFLLVFASGSSNSLLGSELHANFKLDSRGEYLALVRPDGVTVASSFEPAYPEQAADISFGLRPGTTQVPLVTTNSACRFKVPADASDDAAWAGASFDDGAWSEGLFGIGCQGAPAALAGTIRTTVPDDTTGVYVRCSFDAPDPAAIDFLTLRVRYSDGFGAYLNGMRVAGVSEPASPQWNSLATADKPDSGAPDFEEFDISGFRSLLVAGTNVLAIRILSASTNPAASADMLLAVELRGEVYTAGAGSGWRYFHQPTPGARNVLGVTDFTGPVIFGVDHGFFTQPFLLTLTATTPGSAIYYTTNSCEPSAACGALYGGPFEVGTTTVVRARAFRVNEEPSKVATRTYLFPEDVIRQPSMDPRITQDAVFGPLMPGSLLSHPAVSIVVSNGIDKISEHAASVELIAPGGGEPGFQVDAGVKYVGSYSLFFAKKSVRVYFRSRYGEGRLRYPLFAGHPYGDGGVSEYDEVTLRSSEDSLLDPVSYRFAQYARNIWVDDLQLEMGDTGLRGRFVHVYLNGAYWGLYHLRERPTGAHMAAYEGGAESEYSFQSLTSPSATWDVIRNAAISNNFGVAKSYLNERQFIDYMLLNFYAGNLDWYSNRNWEACGTVLPNRDGWKFFSWDSDRVLQSETVNTLSSLVPGGVFDAMLRDPDFRTGVADGIYRHFFRDGVLTPARAREAYDRRAGEISLSVVAETARWQPATLWTRDNWLAELGRLDNDFFALRTDIVVQQFRNAGLYPLAAPEFSTSGGLFRAAFDLGMSAAAPIYFTLDGTDPRTPGTGEASGALYSAPVRIAGTVRVKARARSGGTWSALREELFVADGPSPLRVTELMFHPREPGASELGPTGVVWTASDFEFIELINVGSEPAGLAGVHFGDGIDFDFSGGRMTALAPGVYVLVVRNRSAFVTRYPSVPEAMIAGEFERVKNWPVKALSDAGERVSLLDGLGSNIVSFAYGDGRDWPIAADGAGHSLVPVAAEDLSMALNYGGNWRASAYIDGSPGAADPEPVRDVLLNEIGAHTDYFDPSHPEYDSNDWLELFNASASAMALGDWYLSDRADDLKLWPIPASNVISALGWRLFDEVHDFHSPITSGFGLNKAGDEVFLSHLPGNGQDRVADVIRFKGQENGASLGRFADGAANWYSLAPTPGAANAAPSGHVAIAAVMFHPPDTNGVDDVTKEFIELYNPQSVTAELWNAEGTWRVDGCVSYRFPPGTQLAPRERIALVAFDPLSNAVGRAAFLSTYGISDGRIRLLGPYAGGLDNVGGRVSLEKPLKPDLAADPLIWVVVDELVYFAGAPWPAVASGTGLMLMRINSGTTALDPKNWFSGSPDIDGNGLPDAWERAFFGENGGPAAAPEADWDGDGLSNAGEYTAGTDPTNAASVFALSVAIDNGQSAPGFEALSVSGPGYGGRVRFYDLLSSSNLLSATWLGVAGYGNVTGNNSMVVCTNLPPAGAAPAFYRGRVRLE